MAHVKWLRSITLIDEPFRGYQQEPAYHMASSDDDIGSPVSRMQPRSLMVPPGIPDFMSRIRYLSPGVCVIEGRAWSGSAPIRQVQVSTNGGNTWADAELKPPVSEFAWRSWRFEWQAGEGEHELCCRATDAAANAQPLATSWNAQGLANNAVQRVRVVVGTGVVPVQPAAGG